MTPALQTHGLVAGYRHRPVLNSLDVAVAPGELVSILGVNGAGKSTLLRTLSGSQKPLAGRVDLAGHDAGAMSAHTLARHVGVLLTERLSLGTMPAGSVVELGRYPHTGWAGLLTGEDRRIIAEAIGAVGATALIDRDFNALSDGERQRILIARALAQSTNVLLLDEPAAFLDVSARVQMMAMLRQLARDKGVAVVLSSHDLELSLRLSDTIWLLDGAGTVLAGAPEDLIAGGQIEAVFSSSAIAFSPGDRAFRMRNHAQRPAGVSGGPEGLDLVRTVLERQGYEIIADADRAEVQVELSTYGWTATRGPDRARGTSYGDLALFLNKADKAKGV
ncbi:MAG: ABC transporter ATP-binding protein [Devosia sp.]|uniref:ABC transporter ATP-binding protein n=1 Tax=Devosia sp. TaxID=1871048 RepID=UPI0024C928C6|nr:ABC transporter ATP-binding protein [Devosia sp.]UYN99416.1 MAG: ABC transporter ATP-binding protein [Devosia sp.]